MFPICLIADQRACKNFNKRRVHYAIFFIPLARGMFLERNTNINQHHTAPSLFFNFPASLLRSVSNPSVIPRSLSCVTLKPG